VRDDQKTDKLVQIATNEEEKGNSPTTDSKKGVVSVSGQLESNEP